MVVKKTRGKRNDDALARKQICALKRWDRHAVAAAAKTRNGLGNKTKKDAHKKHKKTRRR